MRVLQDYEVKPIGSESSIWVDLRVVAATNQDLEEEVQNKTFRKDLYYRLGVITLTVPPLRQRKEDIPALVWNFLEYFRHRIGREITDISEEAMAALCNYAWPGNIRELMNVIERGMLLSQTNVIEIHNLPSVFHTMQLELDEHEGPYLNPTHWKNKSLKAVLMDSRNHIERQYLQMVLKETKGRVGHAAAIAGLHPRGLYNKMKRLGLAKEQFKS
ncbi:sigma 54-interacting transcriptional regulator [Candidatus Sumerlaeota bacterium]